MNKHLTIGLFTDAHTASGVLLSTRYGSHSPKKIATAIQTFAERGVDLIVNLGDAIDLVDGDPVSPAEHLAGVREIVQRCGVPCHMVLGNHDVAYLSKADLLAYSDRAAYYSFNRGGAHFVVLDTNRFEDGSDYCPDHMPEDWGDAWLGDEQLAWLAEDLTKAGKKPTVIFSHADLGERVTADGEDLHVAKDAAAARAIIESAPNVRAVIAGHYHAGRFAEFGKIPHITLGAMCEGPFPEHNAYAILHVHRDGNIEIEGFGDQPSWP